MPSHSHLHLRHRVSSFLGYGAWTGRPSHVLCCESAVLTKLCCVLTSP